MIYRKKKIKLAVVGLGYVGLPLALEFAKRRQGLKVACIEEIAYKKGYISKDELIKLAETYPDNEYRKYLLRCTREDI